MKVRKITERQDVVTARTDETLDAVAEKMNLHRISGLPVVDEGGALAGLVAASDLIRLSSPSVHLDIEKLMDINWSPAHRTTEHDPSWEQLPVTEVMVSEVCTVDDGADIRDAARMMATRGIHRVVVLDADRRVQGVLSSFDLTALVAERGIGSATP
ncbi:MAG: CBS domain-containing protein [Acidobacteriota bacterium]